MRSRYQKCTVEYDPLYDCFDSEKPMKICFMETLIIKYKLKHLYAKCPTCDLEQLLQKDPKHPHNMLIK